MNGKSRVGSALCVLAISTLAAACSSAEPLGAAGASCLLFTDCAPNLVCAPTGKGSALECTADATALISMEDAAVTAKASTDAAVAAGDAGSPSAASDAAPPDAAPPPAPVDASPIAVADAGDEP